MAQAVPLTCGMMGFGTFAGPVIAGAIFDRYGSYVGGWLFAAAALTMGGLLVLAPPGWFGAEGHGEHQIDVLPHATHKHGAPNVAEVARPGTADGQKGAADGDGGSRL
jgi:MFS family permease